MKKLKALIFGFNGQDGYYLKEIVEKDSIECICVSRSAGNWIQGNVADAGFTDSIILNYKPDYIFHLAANSTTRHDVLIENHRTISDGTLNILEAVYKHSPLSKVFISGSALQFENVGVPIKETDNFFAGSPYAAERIYSTYLARYYKKLGIKVYIGYFFHHDSPLRQEKHLNIKILNGALRIKNGSKEILEIGCPEVVKEFNHAEDMMNAIWMLIRQDEIAEAVIGSGKGYSIWEWIDVCSNLLQFDIKNLIKVNRGYVPDFERMVSNPESLMSIGWRPQYSIEGLASDILANHKNA